LKKGIIWLTLAGFMATSLVLSSCATSSSTTVATSTSTTTQNPITTTITTQTTTTTTSVTTTKTTTAGNWWDSLGKPQYGGTITLRLNKDIANFDPANNEQLFTIDSAWMERLHANDWSLNPSVYSYVFQYRTSDYVKGQLAETWEFTNPNTYTVHLRQGIHWQNIPPANGREFTADDVVFDFDRLFGLGDGFTKPATYWGTVALWQQLISVTATDKYTVAFKWQTSNPEFIMETIQAVGSSGTCLENPDAVKLWGDLNDWHHAIGTGPFILMDYVSGSSATLTKNPNYWGYDERYPQNQLPYIDTLRYLIIPDPATSLAALRTAKLDFLDQMSLSQAQSVLKTNPEITQLALPVAQATTVDPRNDVKPFNDVRVREALQLALDLPTIAKSYYGGTCSPNPSALTSEQMKGVGLPYSQWPQDLKDQYAYNPTLAKQLLSAAGYPNGFKTDIVVSSDSDLDLLQVVKSYFLAVNIDMDIRPLDPASWTAFVSVGHKHDQLAMRSSSSLGFTFEPLRQLNRFQTGYSANYLMVSDPTFDAYYPTALADTNMKDIMQVVTDANNYVARQHFAISLLQPNVPSLFWPWIKGYNGQLGSLSGGVGSPQVVAFYLGRFWVDQNLKKSMGH